MFGNFQFGQPYFAQGQVPQQASGGDITAILNVTLQDATLAATATVSGSVQQSGPLPKELAKYLRPKPRRKKATPKVYLKPVPRTASLAVKLKSSTVTATAILGPVPNIGRTNVRLSDSAVECGARVFTQAKSITRLGSSTSTSRAVVRTLAKSTNTLRSATVDAMVERGLSFEEMLDEERILNLVCELV
jgi:hypothetical protein